MAGGDARAPRSPYDPRLTLKLLVYLMASTHEGRGGTVQPGPFDAIMRSVEFGLQLALPVDGPWVRVDAAASRSARSCDSHRPTIRTGIASSFLLCDLGRGRAAPGTHRRWVWSPGLGG